jgi:hypothetical protein
MNFNLKPKFSYDDVNDGFWKEIDVKQIETIRCGGGVYADRTLGGGWHYRHFGRVIADGTVPSQTNRLQD